MSFKVSFNFKQFNVSILYFKSLLAFPVIIGPKQKFIVVYSKIKQEQQKKIIPLTI